MIVLLILLAGGFLLYILGVAAWNLFFHPLRYFPGPKAWIAFPFLRHLAGIRGTVDSQLRDLHKKYGDVVRYSADELSFITADAWRDIYGHKQGNVQLQKTVKLDGLEPPNIIDANDSDHARFRQAMSHAFSSKGLRSLEPIVQRYIDQLIERLSAVSASHKNDPIDIVKWYNLANFDLIGDLAVGQSFGGLYSQEYHYWVATITESIKIIPFIKAMISYPLLFKLVKTYLPPSLMESRKKQFEYSQIAVRKRLQNQSLHGRGDFVDSVMRYRRGMNGSAEKKTMVLTEDELVANASVLITAGSETAATLLSGITYWLLCSPKALERVTTEVRSAFQNENEITFNNVTARLPYMLACVNETLRVYPPIPSTLQRQTGSTAMKISGYEIPPETKVEVHPLAAFWSPRNFHNPDKFVPERWLPEAKDPSSPYYTDNRDVLQPFSMGPRNCIGKSFAYIQVRVFLARILWTFDLELCKESENWKEQKIYTFWEKPPLMCRLTQSQHGADLVMGKPRT